MHVTALRRPEAHAGEGMVITHTHAQHGGVNHSHGNNGGVGEPLGGWHSIVHAGTGEEHFRRSVNNTAVTLSLRVECPPPLLTNPLSGSHCPLRYLLGWSTAQHRVSRAVASAGIRREANPTQNGTPAPLARLLNGEGGEGERCCACIPKGGTTHTTQGTTCATRHTRAAAIPNERETNGPGSVGRSESMMG